MVVPKKVLILLFQVKLEVKKRILEVNLESQAFKYLIKKMLLLMSLINLAAIHSNLSPLELWNFQSLLHQELKKPGLCKQPKAKLKSSKFSN